MRVETLPKLRLAEKQISYSTYSILKNRILGIPTKTSFILLVLVFVYFHASASITEISIAKISNEEKYINAFREIVKNLGYYNHWSPEWTHPKSKADFLKTLQQSYRLFAALDQKNAELALLLGDIAHYQYNLDNQDSFEIAIKHYTSAQQLAPSDYRSYWFLGNHFALSNIPSKAIANFLIAQQINPSSKSISFWSEFAFASAIANMPSHCVYAVDQVKLAGGDVNNLEQTIGATSRARFEAINKLQDHQKTEIWTSQKEDQINFTSRPLGIKILVDSTWNLNIYNYTKRQGVFIINPPAIEHKKGKAIGYTVAIIMKTANDGDRLEDYIKTFVAKYQEVKTINFSNRYDKMISYEIKDKKMYADIGGAHLYVIGIERDKPKYPGMLLENAIDLPKTKASGINYYTAGKVKDRFEGRIFYAIMLDSCEDINVESLAIFKKLFDQQIIIE